MPGRRSNAIISRSFLAAVCLALLASCGGANDASLVQVQVPETPADLRLNGTAGDGQATLAWSASQRASSYHVKRSTTSGGPFTQIAVSSAISYTDNSLTNGITYYYVVSAANSGGESADSSQISVTPQAAVTAPAAPTNPLAIAGNARVTVSWTASSGAVSYSVKRSSTGVAPYDQVGAPTSSPYVDTTALNGTTYYYVISAINTAGASPDSSQVSATPQAAATPPAVPTNLTATAGNAQVGLTWSGSTGATNYYVKRATSSTGTYTQVAISSATSLTDSGLSNGTTYYYVVSAANEVGQSANSSLASATPQAPATVPAAPGNLSATAGNAQVALTWSASSGATSYNLKRSTTSGGPYTQVTTATATSYTNTGLTNNTTYYYVISAVNAVGEGANSAQVGATPQAPVVVPSAPTNVLATAGNAQIGLTWSASSGATSYSIKRSGTSGGPYTQVARSATASYTDTALTNGTTYYYVVSALNSAGEGANSVQVSATPQAPLVAPATPTNFTVTAGNTQVSLAWSASSGAASYNLKRSSTSGGPYSTITTATSTSYVDAGLTNGTTYYYVISAVNSAGESANTAQLGATPQAPVVAPSAPTNLVATAGNAQVILGWSASSGATSYNLKRSTSSTGSYSTIATLTTLSYTDDSGLSNGTTYYYVVTASNSAGESANSGSASATPQAPIAIPAAPGSLVAVAGNAQATLTWAASSAATSYKLKRSTTSGGPYTTLTSPTVTSYIDSPLNNGTTYYYVVSAVNSAGESTNSTQVSAAPLAPVVVPAAPTNLVASAGNAQVNLSWSASSGATSYTVKRSTTSGSGYATVTTSASTSYVDAGISNGTAYYYVVSASNSAGESANSAQASATPQAPVTVPAPPLNLVATAGSGQVSLTWSASSGATSYVLKRSTTSGSGYAQVVATGSTSYIDTAVTGGTTYYYVVSALNTAGESANSAQSSATPQVVVTVPAAPTGLVATAGDSQVSLSWTASSGATSYTVKRSTTSGGTYATVTTTASTSYVDTGRTNGTIYYYVVSATNSAGEGANSTQASATPAASGATYSTTFGTAESPISEGGSWKHNNPWFTKVVTSGGRAYGTEPNPQNAGKYEDSYAILNNASFPANQYASGHIYKNGAGGYLEVELLLRFSDSANSTQGYECFLHQNGEYISIARWNGGALTAAATINYFAILASANNITAPRDGDLFEAQIVGNIITVKLAGATILTTDVSQYDGTVIASGNPGIGFDAGGSGQETANSTYGLADFSAQGL
ncbi:MAG: fibronectin type III domain-containing protein [Pseudomonadota bacterium]